MSCIFLKRGNKTSPDFYWCHVKLRVISIDQGRSKAELYPVVVSSSVFFFYKEKVQYYAQEVALKSLPWKNTNEHLTVLLFPNLIL